MIGLIVALALAPATPEPGATPAPAAVLYVVLEAKVGDVSLYPGRRARVEVYIEDEAPAFGVPRVSAVSLEVQVKRVVVRGSACPAEEAGEAITETGGAQLEFTCPAVDAPGASQTTRAAL